MGHFALQFKTLMTESLSNRFGSLDSLSLDLVVVKLDGIVAVKEVVQVALVVEPRIRRTLEPSSLGGAERLVEIGQGFGGGRPLGRRRRRSLSPDLRCCGLTVYGQFAFFASVMQGAPNTACTPARGWLKRGLCAGRG